MKRTSIGSTIDNILLSETKLDLINLFTKNPSMADTIEGIALRIGKTGEAIKDDIEDLERIGFLNKKYIGHAAIFQVDPVVLKEIHGFLSKKQWEQK
jgi:hypothetical protein